MKEQSQDLFSDRRVSLIKHSASDISWKIKLNDEETGLSIGQSVIEGLKKSLVIISESKYLELTIKNITRCLVKYGVILTSPEKDNLKKVILSLI